MQNTKVVLPDMTGEVSRSAIFAMVFVSVVAVAAVFVEFM
jgi:hypothetical protein